MLSSNAFGLFYWELTPDRIVLMILALPGGIVGIHALYKLYKYGTDRIWDVLDKALKEELGRFERRRAVVLKHIQDAKPQETTESAFVDVHGTIDEALEIFDRGTPKAKRTAEASLVYLADELEAKAKTADLRMKLARQQAASALVFAGAMARTRGDLAAALTMFERALRINPDDTDALKYIGMLRPSQAFDRFEAIEKIAAKREDKALQAEALRLKSTTQVDTAAKLTLEEAVSVEEARNPKDYGTLAESYKMWAEVSVRTDGYRGVPRQAIERYKMAAEAYRSAGDIKSANAMDATAQALRRPNDGPPTTGPSASN